MNRDLERAVSLLRAEGYTCVLVCGDTVRTSTERGVKPLLTLFREQNGNKYPFAGFSAADKVVGKATAFLYVLLGVKRVYAAVVSKPAADVLRTHGVELLFDLQVEAIRNRAGDGFCPMEQAVRAVVDPADAPLAIQRALDALKANG